MKEINYKRTTADISWAATEILWYDVEGRIQSFREIWMLEYTYHKEPHSFNPSLCLPREVKDILFATILRNACLLE